MTMCIQQSFPGVTGKTYLLLENGDEKLERVYALEQAPEPISLFADTELAAHQEQGPLLLCLSGSALLDEYRNAPNDWRGLARADPATDLAWRHLGRQRPRPEPLAQPEQSQRRCRSRATATDAA